MSKNKAEQSNSLSIFWLKKQGYLPSYGWASSGITWTYGWSENKSSIGFSVSTKIPRGEDHINLQYTHTDSWTSEKESLDYKVQLVTTPCHFGGERFWFICPLTRDGQYCGRRIGVLYSVGKYFGCRRCGDIAYAGQMKGGRFRTSVVSVPDIERAREEVKRYYYNGQPTRKYRRYLRLDARLTQDLMIMSAGLQSRVKKLDIRHQK